MMSMATSLRRGGRGGDFGESGFEDFADGVDVRFGEDGQGGQEADARRIGAVVEGDDAGVEELGEKSLGGFFGAVERREGNHAADAVGSADEVGVALGNGAEAVDEAV